MDGKRRALTLSLAVLLLAGCSNPKLEDLRKFTQDAYKNRKPQVEPLPVFQPTESFTYTASKLLDPFSPNNLKTQVANASGSDVHAPNPNRRREPLESYPLDSLKLVGTLRRGNKVWAIISAPDSSVYHVQKGNYIGQNFGLITKITDARVDVRELIRGPTGHWIERSAKLAAK